jgi:hypothetical protein
MAPRRDLSVACVIDARVAAEICGERIRSPNASYDASVLAALCRLYRDVHLVRARFDTDRTLEELRALRPDVIFNLAFSATDFEASRIADLAPVRSVRGLRRVHRRALREAG